MYRNVASHQPVHQREGECVRCGVCVCGELELVGVMGWCSRSAAVCVAYAGGTRLGTTMTRLFVVFPGSFIQEALVKMQKQFRNMRNDRVHNPLNLQEASLNAAL